MYSKWNKVDLHIHTDMSKITKSNDYEGKFSIDTLYSKLKENNIDLISLTDHNIINCDAYEKLSQKDIKFLVGVELDVSISKKEMISYIKRLKSNSDDKIKIKPFHALVLFRTLDYEAVSSKLERMYSTISENVLKGISDLTVNKFHRVTTIEFIVKHFCDEDFFIIAHGNKDKGIVEPYSKVKKIGEAQNEILVGGISALEMKSNANIENVINHYNEGFQKLLRDDFKQTKTTSYVVFSDNHNCQNYEPRKMQTWIKGHPTYETLRLAFSDPESRIHTSEHEPKLNTNYIEKICLTINDSESQIIEFSPQLNVIIGGRSSGKSLLFNTLINMNNEFTEDDKAIFKKNYSTLVDIANSSAKLSIGNYADSISIPGEAFYQEAIIKLFEKENDLKTKLENEFIEISDSEIRHKENYLDDIVTEFNNAYKEYYDIASKINKGDIRQHIDIALRNSEKLFEIDFSQLNVKKNLNDYDEVFKELDNFLETSKSLKELKLDGEDVLSEDDKKLLTELVSNINNKKLIIEKKKIKEDIRIRFKYELECILNNYITKELTNEKQMIEKTRNKLDEYIIEYESYFISKLRLRQACKEIEMLNLKIEDKINKKSKYKFITKVNLNISGNKIINDFFKEKIINYDPNINLYMNILNLADITIEDVRLKQYTVDGKKPEILRDKFNTYIKNTKSKKTYEIIECLEDGHEISTLSTSQGKKASIFLDIKLKNLLGVHNKNVLFIDQLEDNIDNKYISEELVGLVRELKRKIQVILVTHNPSIAIYGDAENIIIAENGGNKFFYKQGGLENIDIREEACKILDGGEVAFKNRMDKYNIAILNEEVEQC